MKLFAFDMDGTLLNSKEQIPQESFDALQKAKDAGHKLIICTGRPIADINRVEGVKNGFFDYFVCNNGSYMFDLQKQELIFDKTISLEVGEEMISSVKDIPLLYVFHSSAGAARGASFTKENEPSWFERVANDEWYKWKDELSQTLEQAKEKVKDAKITQMSFRTDLETTPRIFDRINEKFSDEYDIRVSNGFYIDVNPKGINKFSAIQKVIKLMNLDFDQLIVFGDSGNDVDMLKNADIGICLGNGTTEAKSVADEIIGDHNTDALAKKVLELI